MGSSSISGYAVRSDACCGGLGFVVLVSFHGRSMYASRPQSLVSLTPELSKARLFQSLLSAQEYVDSMHHNGDFSARVVRY